MAIQTRLPTGDSAVDNGWSSSSGTTKAADTDDPIGSNDGDTTYAFKNGANANQLHTFSAFAIPTGSTNITVSVVYFARRTSTSVTVNPRVRVNGVTFEGAGAVPSTSYASVKVDWTTNPNTTLAWTVNDVNGSGASPLQEFGYANTQTTSGEEARVTQAYLQVTFTPPAIMTLPPLMTGGFTDMTGDMV